MNQQLFPGLSNPHLTCFMFALLLSAACASSARAQGSPPALERQGAERRQAARTVQDADDDADEVSAPPAAVDPATVLRGARFVLVRSDSAFVSGREVEDSL